MRRPRTSMRTAPGASLAEQHAPHSDIVYPSAIDYAWAWWATADIRATLLSVDHVPSEAHDFYDDIPAGVRLAEVTVTTGQRSVSGGKCFCDSLTFSSVAGGFQSPHRFISRAEYLFLRVQ